MTLECALSSPHRSDREMDEQERLRRLHEARARLERTCNNYLTAPDKSSKISTINNIKFDIKECDKYGNKDCPSE